MTESEGETEDVEPKDETKATSVMMGIAKSGYRRKRVKNDKVPVKNSTKNV